MNKKIKVCSNLEEVERFLQQNNDLKICFYLADKTIEDWEISTSRIYMNKINEKFVYLPINIKKGDRQSIKLLYELAEKNDKIVAINQTHPHKSNAVLQEKFAKQSMPTNVDALVKNKEKKLIGYNFNGPAFVQWFEEKITTLENKTIIIFGVGGAGEAIVREIATKGVETIYLIDINSKETLCKQISNKAKVYYFNQLSKINFPSKEFILINCAGKEGAKDKEMKEIVKKFKNRNNTIIDIRAQLKIALIEEAKKFDWKAYTGFEMNCRNDYALLRKINEIMNINIPNFTEFVKLVEEASNNRNY